MLISFIIRYILQKIDLFIIYYIFNIIYTNLYKMANNNKTMINYEVNKLIGINEKEIIKQIDSLNHNWKKCFYCEKMHHKDYYINTMNYCIHCWAWLNFYDYDLTTGKYNGSDTSQEIKNINEKIKNIYKIHLQAKCKNNECIFNKIKELAEKKTLHTSLIELLELNEKIELKPTKINNKNKNLNIDYEKSYIII